MSTAELDQSLAFNATEPESAPSTGADFSLSVAPRLRLVEEYPDKVLSPVDKLTNMPLPILPTRQGPRFKNPAFANWHHHYHPSDDPNLTSASGLAIRHLRLQLLPVKSRHQIYHNLFSGPEFLPESQADRFGHIILACAGYMPRSAIDVTADDPATPVQMSSKIHERLQTSGEIVVRGQPNIANFIRKYLVIQDLSNINESVIDEFLSTNSIERKRYLGHWLLALASEIATEPVKPIYRQALDDGLIRSKAKPESIVKSTFSGEKSRNKAIDDLRRRLASLKAA